MWGCVIAQPVWVLSVDLQTKTATFKSGLADAAKTARGAFNDIKSGGDEMGRAVGTNMFEARHGVMLLGEEFGVHLPRALTAFITSIGPIGAAMEAAFPFLAIAVGATLLIEHLVKLQEEGQKLTQDQAKFATAAQNAFNQLEDKLLQAGIRADELRNDHLGALAKQLELIDHQSMFELVRSFEDVRKGADKVFEDLKKSWYEFGSGSAGAKNALDQFQIAYNDLLAKHKDKEASDLLAGTRQSAVETLALIKQAQASEPKRSATGAIVGGDQVKYQMALTELELRGAKADQDALQTQLAVVAALEQQAANQREIANIKKQDSANATKATGNEEAARQAAQARAAADSQARMGQQYIAADKATANARLEIARASVQERLQSALEFAQREYDLAVATNAAQMAALDKSGKDYQTQLKALKEKELELIAEHDAKVAELSAHASVEENAKRIQAIEQSVREQINATQQGSAARLAVIMAAIKTEEDAGRQDANFYRELGQQRIETTRQMTEEESKLRAEAGKESADNEMRLAELSLQATKQTQALLDSIRHVSIDQQIAEETQAANTEYQIKLKAMQREIQALDKGAKDYENKLKAIQNKETQLVRAHENEITAIKEKAEIQRNQNLLSAEGRLADSIAQGLTQSIMRHQTWGQMITSIGNQVVSGMLQNAIKSMLTLDMTKEKEAAAAARKMFNIGLQFPFPANVVLAPAMAAAGFAAVMAFEGGTDRVPGYGKGDTVPAVLAPGEGVVPGGVMDGLRNMVRNGGIGGGNTTHVHYRPTYHVQAIDRDGVEDMLNKHNQAFTRHMRGELRRANK